VDRRDLLILSLLLHDVGKGMPVESHVAGSLQALETAADRLKLSPEEKSEVHFLIEHHLDMSPPFSAATFLILPQFPDSPPSPAARNACSGFACSPTRIFTP